MPLAPASTSDRNGAAGRTSRHPPLLALFSRQVAANADAVAIVHHQRHLRYGELDAWSNQLARWLAERISAAPGATPLVPFCLRRGPDQIAILLAILKLGAAYVPLDRHAPPARNRHILEDIGAPVLITDASTHGDMRELLAGHGRAVPLIDLDEDRPLVRACWNEPLDREPPPDGTCYVMYTSGSTGRPKGSLVPCRGVVRLVHETNYMTITPADCFSQAASVSFDAATFEIWGALLNGARLVLVDTDVAVDPRRLRRLLEQERVTISFFTTGLFNQHVAADPEMFGGLRYLMFGGEAASVEAVRRLWGSAYRPTHLYNVYGPTENTTYSTFHSIEALPEPGVPIPIGKAIRGTSCHVVDERMRPVAPGATGELLVGGEGVARGYLGHPELTADKFVPSPFADGDVLYRTGDVVKLREDGALVFVGRADNQVKIRGFRIETEEVELALGSHPDLAEVAVLVEDDVTGTKRLAAYVGVAEGRPTPTVGALRAHMGTRVPPYMVPAIFRRVAAFPLGLTGKVDRRALASLPAETLASEAELLAPRAALEAEVREVWARHLGVGAASVGVEANFFELGGQSLQAAAIVQELANRRGIDLRLADMLGSPTVAKVARAVARAAQREAVRLPAADRNDDLPLSWSQEQVWLHQQAAPDMPYYNEPLDVTLPESIDVESLERALACVLERHESLRLRIDVRKGLPRQRIEPLGSFRLPFVDLRHVPAERRPDEARKLATALAVRPFDLALEAPVRFLLVRIEAELFRLYLTGHHLALDGVGMFHVFLPELESAYRACLCGEAPRLPPLSFGFRDWLVWQRETAEPPSWAGQLDYWAQQLADFPVLDLPTDRTRGAEERFEGSRVRIEIGSHVTARLKDIARGQQASLFSTLLAAFQILLYRYTQQPDVAVGSVVAGRGLPGLDRLVCDTLNTILLRTRIPADASFLDVIDAAHRTSVEAFANQDAPFQQVARRFTLDAIRERSAPIQVVFVLEPGMPPSPAGWEMNQIEVHTDTAKFDLLMELDEREDRIIGRVEYRADLFDRATVERLTRHYRTLLEGIADSPATLVTRLPLMDEDERRRVLVTWNDTRVDYAGPPNVHTLVEARAARHPEAPAILQGERVVTFGELVAEARGIAGRLAAAGVRLGDRVGVYTDRIPEHFVGQLGCWQAGAAWVPLSADEPVERARLILEDAGVRAVLVDRERAARLEGLPVPRVVVDGGEAVREPPTVTVSGSDIAYVIYTSGSTGRPKGALIDHRANVERTMWAGAGIRIGPGDVAIHLYSLAFDCTLMPSWWTLSNGGAMVLPRSGELQDPEAIVRLVQRHRVTQAMATPAFWKVLVASFEQGDVQLRLAGAAGERLPRDLYERLRRRAARVMNMYGPTETTVLCTVWEDERLEHESPPIGGPLANVRLYVLDPQGEPVPIGVRGELYIGGAGVGRGYLNLPERTREAFVPDPFAGGIMYRSGDIVRWLPTGEIDCLGRADHQVKIRGFRVELGEIEACLLVHPSVSACIVVAQEAPSGKRLIAYAVGDPEGDLRGYLRERLPSAMVPSAIVFLDRLPLTPNGKVDRKALPAPDADEEAAGAPPPQTMGAIEHTILDCFRAALGSNSIGPRDDFFEAGGDSLGAMQMVAKAAEEGVSFSVRDLMRHRTALALAEAVRRSDAAARFAENPPVYLASDDSTPAEPAVDVRVPDQLRASSALLPFREESGERPLFFVHPAGGSAVCYHHLAEHLPGQPFYGLECVEGYQGKSVAGMAAEYLAEVRRVQPCGPYLLGGWSFGGNVAFEMARQLEENGGEAAVVIVIDSRPLTHAAQLRFLDTMNEDSAAILCLIGRHFTQITGKSEPLGYAALRALPESERRGAFLTAVERGAMFPRQMAESFVTRFVDDFAASMRIFREHRPAGRIRADVLLLRAAEVSTHYEGFPAMEEPLNTTADPSYGWIALTSGRVTVHSIPGTHETCVFPPHVSAAAVHVRAELRRRTGRARHFDALPSLTAAQWSRMLERMESVTVRPGDLLIEKGASDRRLYIIASGLLEVLAGTPERRVREGGSGTVLGELAFIDGQSRTGSVRALSEVTAYSLTPESFKLLDRAVPELASTIALSVAGVVAQRFRELIV